MTEHEAKQKLEEMLESYTAGSVLHLLSDIHAQAAESARHADDAVKFERSKLIEHTLFVVGLGIDSANPF